MFGWCTKQFQTEINNFCAAFILMCATRQPKNLQHTLNSHVDTPHTNILINIKYVADGGWRYIMTWTNCWKLFAVSAFGHYFYSLGLFRLCVFSLLIFCFRFCFCFRRFERRADFKISHVFEKMNRIECACVSSEYLPEILNLLCNENSPSQGHTRLRLHRFWCAPSPRMCCKCISI